MRAPPRNLVLRGQLLGVNDDDRHVAWMRLDSSFSSVGHCSEHLRM